MSKPDRSSDPTLADLLGSSFALVQHGLDKVIAWGFGKLKETEKVKPEKIENPTLRCAAGIGRSVLVFLGKAGESYYRSYEELKSNIKKQK